jgi:hypothetical protein
LIFVRLHDRPPQMIGRALERVRRAQREVLAVRWRDELEPDR